MEYKEKILEFYFIFLFTYFGIYLIIKWTFFFFAFGV